MSSTPAGAVQVSSLAGDWQIVPALSEARFAVRDKLVTVVHGTFPIAAGSGQIHADGTVTHAVLELTVADVATGNTHRDRDLRKPAFLDAAGHPVIHIDVANAERTAEGWSGTGTLSVRGATAPLDLVAALRAATTSELRIDVSTRLDRRPLGIRAPVFIVGRYIDIDATLVCRRVTP